ncbi:gamma-glutamyl-gamma-aminobutyrate hydrolase family protein [Bordetella bronchialis]
MEPSTIRIGVTMRVTQAEGYSEPRDALAQAWGRFLNHALPDAAWLPVPNLGEADAVEYCQRWGINRLILTGGEDVGKSPLRDATEGALIRWAEVARIPVLGVCRGMQLMCLRAGIDLKNVACHVATRHAISGEVTGEVNSFHTLAPVQCPPGFDVLATAADGELEAVRHATLKWEGWMWHPEREAQPDTRDVDRLRSLFE